jgi:hypothetical protein
VRLSEIDLFGVYVAPLSVIMGVAWLLLLLLRRAAVFTGLAHYVWHPALFSLAVYVILVSSIVLVVAH